MGGVEPMAPYLEPVRKSVTVPLTPREAFDLFTARIASWWPLGERFSISGTRAMTCAIEPRVGGAVYEVRDDGEKLPWGMVLTWEPPRRVVLSWHPGKSPDVAQEVEVTFAAERMGTRVELIHRNWQQLGDQATDVRASYDGGWETVFASAFADAAARRHGG
jgi:uncharacterized protein YndB with AHSA1/START domain